MSRGTGLNLPIYVNDKQVESSFNEINKDYYKLLASVKKLKEGTEEWEDANTRLALKERERNDMIKRQKAYREEMIKSIDATDGNTDALNEFSDSFSQAFTSARNGDIMGFQEGMKGVAGSIRTATRAGLAFLATPIGAGITVLAGIALATREWINYNEAVKEANVTTQQITQLSGQALDNARLRGQTIQETFGQDFENTLTTAKALVQAFGISYEEAFERIEDGLIRGGNKNEEFMKSMREYPKLFAQAGFTIEDFQRLVNTGIDMGVYDDKLPDAIKEFSLSVMEQTTASREAMINAFGRGFTDRLFNGIKDGSVTVKDALGLVAEEAQKIGLNAQEAQQLTADLFRGAGEDAGGAQLIFEAVNRSLNGQQRELTALEEHLQQTSEANLELAKAQDEALKSDNYAAFSNSVSLAWTRIKTGFFRLVGDLVDGLSNIHQFTSRTFAQITAVIFNFPTVVKDNFLEVRKEVLDVVMSFGKLGDVVSNLMDFNFEGAKSAALDFKNSFQKEANDVKKSAGDMVNDLLKISETAGRLSDEKFERARQGAGEALRQDPEDPQSGSTGYKPADKEEDVDKIAEKRAEKEKAIREKVEATLKEWEEERAIKEELEKIDKEKRAEEEEILKLENKFAKLEEQAQGEKELLARLETEKKEQIQDIRDKYDEERLEKEKIANEKLAKQNKEFFDRLIAAEENLQNSKNQAYQTGIGALKGFFDNASGIYLGLLALEKGLAINEVIVNASKAIAVAKANHAAVPPVIGVAPNPMWAVSAAITAKNILATKIAAGAEIASIAATALQGFYYGGETGNNEMPFRDSTGRKPVGYVHKNEYVIPEVVRRDPEMPVIEDYIERKRRKAIGLGGYYEGGETNGSSTNTIDTRSTEASSKTEALLKQLIEVTAAKGDILFGYEAEKKRQEAERKLKKIEDRSKIKKKRNGGNS